MSRCDFDRLVSEALAKDFSWWDFSWLRGRCIEETGAFRAKAVRFLLEARKAA